MDNTSFGQLAKKLETAISWLESNGIKIQNTRIKAYHAALTERLPLEISSATEEQHNEFMATAFEAHMLVEVFDHFPRTHMDVLLSKIEKILEGPLFPEKEAHHSKKGEARNFQYELLIASTLNKKGLEVGFTKGNKEDLHFFYNGEKVFCECKRPLSEKGLPDAIREATNQLKNRLTPGFTKEKGILAISIDKIDKTKNQGVEFGSYEEAEAYLNQQIKAIFTTQGRLIVRKMEKKIPGTIVSLFTPFKMRGNISNLFTLNLNAFMPFDYENGFNYRYMDQLRLALLDNKEKIDQDH